MCTFMERIDQASGHVVLTKLSSLWVVELAQLVELVQLVDLVQLAKEAKEYHQ